MKKITLLMLIVFTMSIQAQNKLLSSITEYYNGTWSTSSGFNYEYDSNNNLIKESYLNWNNGTWEIKSTSSYTYNANNKVTEEIYKSTWSSPTNTLENSYKDNYTYTSGNLTEIVYSEWVNSNWVFISKTAITYNANNLPVTFLSYEWDGSQWVTYEKGTLTYNANNKLISEVYEDWVGAAQWVNSYKTIYTYNANNKIISNKSADWDQFNTIWVENGDKTDYEWDATGNKSRETDYYKYSDGSLSQHKQEYTYDTFNLMSSFAHPFKDKTGFDFIFEDAPHVNKVQGYNSFSYNQSTSSYILSGRTTYNYNNSITLGVEQEAIPVSKITVYPNPTKDFLNIQNTSNTSIDKVIVSDISGKTILQQNQNSTQLDVKNLAKGMYLLQLTSGDKTWKTKFLKE